MSTRAHTQQFSIALSEKLRFSGTDDLYGPMCTTREPARVIHWRSPARHGVPPAHSTPGRSLALETHYQQSCRADVSNQSGSCQRFERTDYGNRQRLVRLFLCRFVGFVLGQRPFRGPLCDSGASALISAAGPACLRFHHRLVVGFVLALVGLVVAGIRDRNLGRGASSRGWGAF